VRGRVQRLHLAGCGACRRGKGCHECIMGVSVCPRARHGVRVCPCHHGEPGACMSAHGGGGGGGAASGPPHAGPCCTRARTSAEHGHTNAALRPPSDHHTAAVSRHAARHHCCCCKEGLRLAGPPHGTSSSSAASGGGVNGSGRDGLQLQGRWQRPDCGCSGMCLGSNTGGCFAWLLLNTRATTAAAVRGCCGCCGRCCVLCLWRCGCRHCPEPNRAVGTS
jgi:hypothetical protein